MHTNAHAHTQKNAHHCYKLSTLHAFIIIFNLMCLIQMAADGSEWLHLYSEVGILNKYYHHHHHHHFLESGKDSTICKKQFSIEKHIKH